MGPRSFRPAIATVVLAAVLPLHAQTTFQVNSTGDGHLTSTRGETACETVFGNGVCTLRAAIEIVNRRNTGLDRITFHVGTAAITLNSALPDLSTPVTITGPGAAIVTVQRNLSYTSPMSTPQFRIFNVTTSGTVSISGLTISNGSTFSQTDYLGGGIQNYNAGIINLTDCVLTANQAHRYFDNSGNVGPYGLGGAIANRAGGTINITTSTIGSVPVTGGNATAGNDADYGGGMYNSGSGTISIIDSNTSLGNSGVLSGGAIYNDGIVNLAGTTVENNHAPSGGGIYNNATLTVANCTFEHNESSEDGGGIYNTSTASVNISNSTFYLNFTNGVSCCQSACGGAIFNANALSVFGSTFTLNNVGGDGSRIGGGAIFNDTGATAAIRSSIFSGNRIVTGTQGVVGGNNLYGSFTSRGFNIIESTDNNTGFTDRTDLTLTDPMFELDSSNEPYLKANGGPTDTIALLCGSPAIDQGSSTLTSLSGNIDATTTSITVADASMIPSAVGFTIQIGTENMVVTSKSANTLTVTRGANGTTAASHAFKVSVRSAFDQRGGSPHARIFDDVTVGNAFDGSDVGSYELEGPCGGLTCNQAVFSEDFDNVTAPALPSGWRSEDLDVPAQQWTTSSTTPEIPPNDAFVADPAFEIDSRLYSPVITVPSSNARLTFRNNYSLYYTGRPYDNSDGGVLEISINGGAYLDIVDAGGSFMSGGYNGTTGVNNPVFNCCHDFDSNGGRAVWTGNTNGYVTTVVNLPSSAAGQSVQFRWRMGAVNPSPNQTKTPGQGWRIDTINLLGCTPSVPLHIISITPNGSNIAVTFQATQRGTYRLERKLSLTDASWQSISAVTDLTAASTGPAQITDTTGPMSLGKAFYRVRLLFP